MKLHSRAVRFFLILAACILLLAGCGDLKPEQTVPETTAAPVTYTVRFTVLGSVCSEQTVEEGMFPQQVDYDPEGLRLQTWLDDAGNAADPFTTAVVRDMEYTALAYPELTEHVPYLFVDAEGFLRPDDALTADALLEAVRALAASGAENFFPGMPAGAQRINVGTLKGILEHFFDKGAVQSAFAGAEDEPVTRAVFALGMNTLLGRSASKSVELAQDAVLPGDVTWSREDIVSLLEASVAHTPSESGVPWEQVQIPAAYEPGFVNIDGWLYYVDEDGCFLRSGTVGVLTFGENGRYTSGDAELDEIVAQILAPIQEAAPDADRLDWLRSAYEYSRDSFKYQRRNAYEVGDTGWEAADAKTMFLSGRGNCYNYAAAFWALARGLGYEARAISGTCLKDEQPHGWVFIEIDGADYLFDPEWEMVYRTERDDFSKDMFMLTMAEIGWWNYRWKG